MVSHSLHSMPHPCPTFIPPTHRSAHGGKAGARSAPGSSRGRASAVRLSGEAGLITKPLEAFLGRGRREGGKAGARSAPGSSRGRASEVRRSGEAGLGWTLRGGLESQSDEADLWWIWDGARGS